MAKQHTLAALLLCIWLSLVILTDAGGYGKFRKHLRKYPEGVPEEIRYFNHEPVPFLKESELPTDFDWCNIDGQNWCTPNWNQHIPKYCGSCFLHGTLSMIADRLKIAKGCRSPDVMLGRQTFLNCAPPLGYSLGCDGGDVIDVMRYMSKHGLPDEGCMPYSAMDYRALGLKKHDKCKPIHHCTNCMPDDKDPNKDKCWAIKKPLIYKVSAYGNVGMTKPDPSNMEAMMSEIYQRGPITCSISCPEDFVYKYDGGIYLDKTNDTDVDHDIEVVGWGVDKATGTKYWKIRNSWGQYWGVNSFARIVRGINAQQIEAGDCWYAIPDFSVEQAVADGEFIGSMDGLKKNKNHPQTIQPLRKGRNSMDTAEVL